MWLIVGLALLGGGGAAAQERSREDELFGGDPAQEEVVSPEDSLDPPAASPAPGGLLAGTPFEEVEPGDSAKEMFETGDFGPSDPLKIGGMLYLRGYTQLSQETSIGDSWYAAPTLLDVYFDARVSERVRGFVLGRLVYDPALNAGANLGVLSSSSIFLGGATSNPAVALDQAWLRFDVGRKVFITVGQQHVRWGAAHIWNPTDFLTPQRRNPLLPFDPRTGASMLKVHVPWEAQGWNFYAIALLDNATGANVLGRIGGAVRAEAVVGDAELGADAVLQLGRRPRLGLDFSAPLGGLDLYGEVALKTGNDTLLWRMADTPDPTRGPAGLFESYVPQGLAPAAAAGVTWTIPYSDNRTLTLGAEYFYHANGYDSLEFYPWLIFNGAYQPFYVGRHYAALFMLLPAPWDQNYGTINLANLANLSDRSFVSRLDVSFRVLTHLVFEAFAAVHYGTAGGEFRLTLNTPEVQLDGKTIPAINLPPPLFELGLGVRISI